MLSPVLCEDAEDDLSIILTLSVPPGRGTIGHSGYPVELASLFPLQLNTSYGSRSIYSNG